MCDTAKANYYYGRTDIEPDTEDGIARARQSEAKGERPILDKNLPWMLLARGMFKFLYKEAIVKDNYNKGVKKRIPGTRLPPKIPAIKPQAWAEAFNIITVSYVRNEFLKQPKAIKESKVNGRTVALAIIVQDPGKGLTKSTSYVADSDQKLETKNILRRMEAHRLEVGDLEEVKKHLAALRDPEVRG